MKHTSINHCANSNYQVDHTEIPSFESWCMDNGVIWAHLFDCKSGQMVATYNNLQGLTTIVG